jgi:hypothetical protein
MADRFIEAFNQKFLLPDWLNDPQNPFNHGSVDIINSGPPEAYTKLVRDAMLKIDNHSHAGITDSIEVLEAKVSDMENAISMVKKRKVPQGTAVQVTQTENVGFKVTVGGKEITGDNGIVTTVHATEPSYIYYNDPTKRWVIAELSVDVAKENAVLTTIPAKSYTVVAFTLKRWLV